MPTNKIILEELFFGKEPSFLKDSEYNLNKALSWYSNQFGPKESKNYTITFLKENKYPKDTIETLSKTKDWVFCNLGFVCRLYSRGAPILLSKIEDKIKIILDRNEVEVEPEEKNERNVQDAIFEQATHIINVIEEVIDGIIKTKTIPSWDCYQFLSTNEIKPVYARHVINHYNGLKEELSHAINKTDDQIVESYSHWNKNVLKNYHEFVSMIIKSCEDYSNNKKVVRKTKSKPLDKKIAKLNYKKEDFEYKIVSINPTEIFSAKQLWVFNSKYKTIGYYTAKDESGLSVKGSTIENFDEQKSKQKTLRKADDAFAKLPKTAKKLNSFFDEMKTKENELTGRINSDVILLRVFK